MSQRRFRLLPSTVIAIGAGLACLSATAPAWAGGFYIQEQSTRGAGRAFSGEVADTGPESLWWNPSSIAESPASAYGSLSGIFPSSDVNNDGSTLTFPGAPPVTFPVGGDPHASNPILDGVVGAAGVSMPILDRFAAGVSVTTPYDFVTDYKENSFARYQAVKSRLDTADIQFTGAWKVTNWVDLGAGADAVYSSARLTQALPNLSPALPDGFSNLSGDAWNWGWNIGAQVHDESRWRIGFSYRSAVGHDLKGGVFISGLLGPLAGANTATQGDAKFTTPWIATLGARVKVLQPFTLNLQIQRFGWSQFRSIEITYPGVFEAIPQNYKDTTSVALGADYDVNPLITVRGGLQWDPTPTPDVGRTLRVPDSDRLLFSAGGEMKLSQHLTVEAAVEYVDSQGSHIDSQVVDYAGTPAETTADYSANITANAVVGSIGGRWRF